MTRTRSIEFAQELGEIPIARLVRGSFESPAQCGSNAGMGRGDLDADHSSIETVHIRNITILVSELHLNCKRPTGRGGFVAAQFAQ
jgi:hypothetical protein